MELSPKVLTDVQFREQWRGYNPDEVDEFLERVAVAVGELQQRLTDALDRASAAERRLLERSDEDEIRRTLVLAQRTAVASMDEARAEADRLVSETEARCRQLVADAEAEAARLEADIATRRRVELGDLAEQRAALQLDIDNLRAFLDGERGRLATVLRGQLEWLDSGYSIAEVPSVSDVAASPMPPAATSPPPSPAPRPPESVAVQPEPEPAPELLEDDADDEQSSIDELRLAREELADALRRAGVQPEAAAADEPLQLEPQRPRPALFDDRAGDTTGTFDVLAEEDDEGEEPRWREDEEEDDPFLAELRRAVIDTEPLGPRAHDDDQESLAVEHGDDGGGFFRRSRRRG
jgi:cell division initiation protein